MALYLEQGEDRARAAARAVREGAARGSPGAGLLRLGAHRRGRRGAARHHREARCPIRPRAIRRCSSRAKARTRSEFTPTPIRTSTSSRTCSRSSIDPFVGKLGMFRVHQGTVTRGHAALRRRRPQAVQGRTPVHAAGQGARSRSTARVPGDIGAVAKVEEIHFDACCTTRTTRITSTCGRSSFRCRCTASPSQPKRRGDEQRISDVLHKLTAEDPTLDRRARPDRQRDRAARPGRPAPALDARAHGERSTARGRDAPAAHALPRDHHREGRGPPPPQEADRRRRAVRRGVPARRAAAARRGLRVRRPGQGRRDPRPAASRRWRRASSRCWTPAPIAGFPLQDVRVTVYDGKYHPVDSKEVAFVAAGKKAFLDAIGKARPIVLEPIVNVEITVPAAERWATSPATCRRAAGRSRAPESSRRCWR